MSEPETAPALLRISGLEKSFGKVRVLKGLDLTVREGEVYGFLGKNGAGKTTAIRTIMGILRADRGGLELFEESGSRPTNVSKQRIGYVAQEQHFYPWMTCRTLGRFVSGFYPTWDGDEYARLLDLLELPPKRKVANLSGGMRAKLALILALAHRPQLLILDEPTAGLDPAARREFLELVREQARSHRRTTFFSSHIVEEVERVADRVGILDRGVLQYEGPIDHLRMSVRRVVLRGSPDREPASPAEREDAPPGPGLSDLPADFRVLAEEDGPGYGASILMASPAAWEDAPFPPDRVGRLSLEDIFLVMVAGRVPRI